MKISGVIILSEQGEIIENLEEVNSVVLIMDFFSLKSFFKGIFSLRIKKLWFLITFLMTAKYLRNETGLSKFYSKSIFEIYDTFESIPARVEFDPKKVLIKKKFFLLSNPFLKMNVSKLERQRKL